MSTFDAKRQSGLKALLRDSAGVSAVEYSFLFGLVALAAIGSLDALGTVTRQSFDNSIDVLSPGAAPEVAQGSVPPPEVATPPEPAPAGEPPLVLDEPPQDYSHPGEPAEAMSNPY